MIFSSALEVAKTHLEAVLHHEKIHQLGRFFNANPLENPSVMEGASFLAPVAFALVIGLALVHFIQIHQLKKRIRRNAKSGVQQNVMELQLGSIPAQSVTPDKGVDLSGIRL